MQALHLTESADKPAMYEELLPSLQAIVAEEPDPIANLANLSAALKQALGQASSWAGFYLLKGEELVLGPFQGKIACTRIRIGQGVCGTAAARRETVVVPDVLAFPGHIFCDPDSRSEIVVPLLRDGALLGVLDVDSARPAAFDEVDARYLERVAALASRLL